MKIDLWDLILKFFSPPKCSKENFSFVIRDHFSSRKKLNFAERIRKRKETNFTYYCVKLYRRVQELYKRYWHRISYMNVQRSGKTKYFHLIWHLYERQEFKQQRITRPLTVKRKELSDYKLHVIGLIWSKSVHWALRQSSCNVSISLLPEVTSIW